MGYEKITFLNLLGFNRGNENDLSVHIKEILKNLQSENKDTVDYRQIDFHDITKESDFSNVDEYLYDLFHSNQHN